MKTSHTLHNLVLSTYVWVYDKHFIFEESDWRYFTYADSPYSTSTFEVDGVEFHVYYKIDAGSWAFCVESTELKWKRLKKFKVLKNSSG